MSRRISPDAFNGSNAAADQKASAIGSSSSVGGLAAIAATLAKRSRSRAPSLKKTGSTSCGSIVAPARSNRTSPSAAEVGPALRPWYLAVCPSDREHHLGLTVGEESRRQCSLTTLPATECAHAPPARSHHRVEPLRREQRLAQAIEARIVHRVGLAEHLPDRLVQGLLEQSTSPFTHLALGGEKRVPEPDLCARRDALRGRGDERRDSVN